MINIFSISYKGSPKEVIDYVKGIDMCKECNGIGEVRTMERVYADDNITAPIGTATCENCSGSGKEQDEEIINERICLA